MANEETGTILEIAQQKQKELGLISSEACETDRKGREQKEKKHKG
jgi:hypothetical protein